MSAAWYKTNKKCVYQLVDERGNLLASVQKSMTGGWNWSVFPLHGQPASGKAISWDVARVRCEEVLGKANRPGEWQD